MRRTGNKILIIILIIISIVAITGGAFAYLYIETDMFRSGQELFAKYLMQDVEEMNQILNFEKISNIDNKLKKSKYEENLTISYSEDEETESVSKLTIDTQNDSINQKYYGIISLGIGEDSLQLEYIKENNIYGIRFTNAVKQFLSVRNSDLKDLITKLGVEEEAIEQIPDTINLEEQNQKLEKIQPTEEEKNTEITKYAELIYNSIAKEKYTKNKNTVITVNGKTITTNAYILKLSEKDVKDILIKLLETIKQDEILLSKIQIIEEVLQDYLEEPLKDSFINYIEDLVEEIKQEEVSQEENILITVYEEKGKTVRIKLEQALEHITIDTLEEENKKQIDINYTKIDEDNTHTSNEIKIIKENENKFNIILNSIDGEIQQTSEIEISIQEKDNNIKLDIIAKGEDGIISITRDINILEEIEYRVTLDNTNNIILNDLPTERISSIFTLVGERLNSKYIEKLFGPTIEETENIESLE